MPRIIGGSAGGRHLGAVPRSGTRPTSDRAREGLFSTIAGLVELAGARVLDLYAGSGAVGLEALSRGAAHALLVESDPRAASAVRTNIDRLGLPGARLVVDRVARVLAQRPDAPYDLAFADPPYALPDAELADVLRALVGHGWLAEGAVVVVERATRGIGPAWPAGTEPVKARRYGEATLWYGRRS